MKWSLALPVPYGLGTPEAESLVSLVSRTAKTYGVSSHWLLQHAYAVGSGSDRVVRTNKTVTTSLFTLSDTTALVVQGLNKLSGRDDTGLTTLLRLKSAVDRRCHGLFAEEYRWCPICRDPDRGVPYHMMAHQMMGVDLCPLHKVALNDRCLGCSHAFRSVRDGIRHDQCPQCSEPLWKQNRAPPSRYREDVWEEEQLLKLIAFSSSPVAAKLPTNWAELFASGLSQLTAYLSENDNDDHLFLDEVIKRSVDCPENQPSISTLLRLATIQACDLVDLMTDPVNFCSPTLLPLRGVKAWSRRRVSYPAELWTALERRIRSYLETDESIPLPSKAEICSSFRMHTSGVWQHFAELGVKYNLERGRRLRLERDQQVAIAVAAAELFVRRKFIAGEDVVVRPYATQLSYRYDVARATMENAMRDAIRKMSEPA